MLTLTLREIIDESDVFVDVHKAIRRMAPAPKARVPKGHVLADHDGSKMDESDLIHLDGELSGPEEPLLRRISHGNGHSEDRQQKRSSITEFGSPKKTFTTRRTSSISGSVPSATAYNTPELREHLRHLGPSNLASRPKSTRYNTVKIKPAAASGQPNIASDGIVRTATEPAQQGGVGAGIISSAGKDAKDGIHALHTGYGSMDRSSPSSRPETSSKSVQTPHDGPNTNGSMGQGQNSAGLSQQERGQASRSPQPSSLLGTNTDPRPLNPGEQRIGIARSGSITENVIDAGGIRKVVLEMTSSSDESSGGADGQVDRLSDVPESKASSADPQKGKKKRRRRKRHNDGKASEESPLLRGEGKS